jgi:hypothetical protein
MGEPATVLLSPDLHDGFLRGVVLGDQEIVELLCSDVDGRRYVLRLPKLMALRADNFLQGNIIFEVNVYTTDFPQDLIKRVYGADGDGEPDWLSARLQEMRDQSWTLLEITSSYGCELLALAKGTLSVESA